MTNKRKPQKQRLADMTIPPPAEELWTPYREGLPGSSTIDLVDGSRIHRRRWWDGQLLTDFLSLQQVEVGDDDEAEWIDIVRVDCCHQEVHVHRLYADPEAVYKVLQPIRTPEGL